MLFPDNMFQDKVYLNRLHFREKQALFLFFAFTTSTFKGCLEMKVVALQGSLSALPRTDGAKTVQMADKISCRGAGTP